MTIRAALLWSLQIKSLGCSEHEAQTETASSTQGCMYAIYCLQSNFCSILYTVCLELQASKKYSSITFEHVPPTAASHRVEGQVTSGLKLFKSYALNSRDKVRFSGATRFRLPSIAVNIHMVFLLLICKLLLSNHRSASYTDDCKMRI